jgi:N-terminal acetyltransferase B complex non-catalytic subunit
VLKVLTKDQSFGFCQIPLVLLLTLSLQFSTAGQVSQAVNTYKLRYLVTCALPEHERRQSPIKSQDNFNCTSCSKPCELECKPCLENAAREAIQSYRIAMDDDGRISKSLLKTDQHPADDLSILASMCLIKLSLRSADSGTEPLNKVSTTYALQAAVLLENAWLHSKHNFQISLVLIRLYKYLGCGSLAMRAYHRLALKNIQLDTLSYTLFDRLSSYHPHPWSQSTDVSLKQRRPLEHLQEQQKLYQSSRKHIIKNSWLSFKHGSYNSIFEMREVSKKLTHSIAAAMSVIESRKISRLTEPGTPLTEFSNAFDLLRKFHYPENLYLTGVDQN